MFIKDYNALFMHPPKTGGTSMNHMLVKGFHIQDWEANSKGVIDYKIRREKYIMGKDGTDLIMHASIEFRLNRLKEFYPSYNISNLFKFATVRNPFTRLVSAYRYNHIEKRYTFKDFVMNQLEAESKVFCGHFQPQHVFTHINDSKIIDHVVHLESFNEDLNLLNAALCSHITPMKVNVQGPIKTSRCGDVSYTPAMRDKVYRIYQKDFEYFNYT